MVLCIGRCNLECKPQCSFTEYKINKKFAAFPSKDSFAHKWALTDQQLNSTDFNYWRKSGYEIKIKFDSMMETEIVKKRNYTFLDTMGAFGGLGALLLGASTISLVEIIVLLLDLTGACRMFIVNNI